MPLIRWSERFRRPPLKMTIDPYLRPEDHPIECDAKARKPRLVPLVVLDYGSVAARFRQVKYIRHDMAGALRELLRSSRDIQNNPYNGKTSIDAATLREVEDYARSLGVTDIGYTVVDPRHIFQGFRILFPNAMVFTMEMDAEKIRQAPTIPSFIEIFRTYAQLGVVVNRVADFLREKGYNAHPAPAIAGEVNFIPLAIDAGLGISGKNGLLITPGNGPRVRLAAVFTDIENLPYAVEKPHGWVREFCETCNSCVRHCPAGAIYERTRAHPDGGPVFIDHTKCADPFSNDNGCTLCIKHCPFSYGDYDAIKARYEATL